jgi:hypothetical protein
MANQLEIYLSDLKPEAQQKALKFLKTAAEATLTSFPRSFYKAHNGYLPDAVSFMTRTVMHT